MSLTLVAINAELEYTEHHYEHVQISEVRQVSMASIEIFCCYARRDQSLLNELRIYLFPLQRYDLINVWNDTDISPGAQREEEINKHLNTAQVILLLISPNFMASDYCYSTQMQRAMERHERG